MATKAPNSPAPPKKNPSDDPEAVPGRRSHLRNVFNACGAGGGWPPWCFRGAREPFKHVAGPESGSVSCYRCCPQGDGATSQEREQEGLLPEGLGRAVAFLCASFPSLPVGNTGWGLLIYLPHRGVVRFSKPVSRQGFHNPQTKGAVDPAQDRSVPLPPLT